MQYELHPGDNYGYEIYRMYRDPEEVSGTIELVKEAQKVQDLIDVRNGFDYLHKMKLDYIILDSWDREGVLNSKDDSLKKFYKNVPVKCQLKKVFLTKNINKSPDIYIYELR